MSENRKWYRLGFRGTNPELEEVEEIGRNEQQKYPVFFLAPKDENGKTLMTHMRSVQADAQGNPNGYYPTPEEAKEAVVDQLQQQLDRMQQAVEEVRSVTL